MMIDTLTAPTDEPVTIAQLKKHLRLPATYNLEDDKLTRDIVTVRLLFEHETGRAITPTQFRQYERGWDTTFRLYRAKVMEPNEEDIDVTVSYFDEDGDVQTFTDFTTELTITPAILHIGTADLPDLHEDKVYPIYIDYWAGFASVPVDVQAALLEGAALKYRFRESEVEAVLKDVCLSWGNIIAKYRTGTGAW